MLTSTQRTLVQESFATIALLWTLEKGLGADWTADVADAWTAAYTTLSGFMINQAYGRPQAAE